MRDGQSARSNAARRVALVARLFGILVTGAAGAGEPDSSGTPADSLAAIPSVEVRAPRVITNVGGASSVSVSTDSLALSAAAATRSRRT